MDAAGEHQTDIEHDIYKTRLLNGIIVKDEKELGANGIFSISSFTLLTGKVVLGIRNASSETAISTNYCGDCYGGTPPESGCCNTCQEVREAYQKKGWAFVGVLEVEQVGTALASFCAHF